MQVTTALPGHLYEILNCAISAICFVALTICIRYLIIEYRETGQFLRLRLAVGLTVFFSGESPRTAWVWYARFQTNTGHNANWMGDWPYVLIPIAGSLLAVIGMACIVRALTPAAWGPRGYLAALGFALCCVIATQLLR